MMGMDRGRRQVYGVVMLSLAGATVLLSLIFSTAAVQKTVATVVELSPNNFKHVVGGQLPVLVKFYAPWCEHCKKLAAPFERVAHLFQKTKSVTLAKVNCDEHKSFCKKFQISEYPTLKWFLKGSRTPKHYDGSPTPEALVDFLNSHLGTSEKILSLKSEVVVLTSKNFDNIALDFNKTVLVKFFSSWSRASRVLAPTYENVASAFEAERDIIVAELDVDVHKAIPYRYGVEVYPTIMIFTKQNKAGETFHATQSLDEIVEFVNQKAGTSRNSMGQLKDEVGRVAIMDEVVNVFLSANPKERSSILSKAEAVAEELEEHSLEYGKIYIKMLKKMLEKGENYIRKEHERLQSLLYSVCT